MNALLVAVALAVFAVAAVGFRGARRRFKRIRRLRSSEETVAAAMEEGRLSQATGQALLQHLEGLRRECSGEP
ncbi:MAG: hypothetical protein V2I67_18360 [Thermoanaerobaculales bacterium]|nr:hypothetical protein [Thermoanaerobaculales bacterium]